MAWFEKLCRRSGLLIHDALRAGPNRRVIRTMAQQQSTPGGLTLRRTTIEEIEIPADGVSPREQDHR
jgi:hypothetical protein